LHESAGFVRPMSRATIDDQGDFALGALDQALQEFDEDSGVEATLAEPALVEPDKRSRPKDKPRALRRYVCSARQSYEKVSRETFGTIAPQNV
jgi:hypothetical protein